MDLCWIALTQSMSEFVIRYDRRASNLVECIIMCYYILGFAGMVTAVAAWFIWGADIFPIDCSRNTGKGPLDYQDRPAASFMLTKQGAAS